MLAHADTLRLLLARGPQTSRALQQATGLSQPTVSRALAALAPELVTLGAARSIRYALLDPGRGYQNLPVYRVDTEGRIAPIGRLLPVRPEGHVMRQADGAAIHHEGLPWWLADMRPRGYLGRAYAARHGAALGLPAALNEWTDAQAVRALVAHGHDVVGNLLLGELAREHFLAAPASVPIAAANKPAAYAALAAQVSRGDMPGSSAGGEQPKFAACAETADGSRHVLVKFSVPAQHAVAERWRDLLLAEHLALETLREAGVAAARTAIVDLGDQRFLEIERFDRIGERGRRAVFSLGSLDDQFLGRRNQPWPDVVQGLADQGLVRPEVAQGAARLYAFGTLIANTDMHAGNLSFLSDGELPCGLAPAYDMLPMGFAPRSGGAMPDTLGPVRLAPGVPAAVWRQAHAWALDYLLRLGAHPGLSPRFAPCLDALAERLFEAGEHIHRLAD